MDERIKATGELVDRAAIQALVADGFDMLFSERMFQHAVRALGLKPTEIVNLKAPQKGRVGLYDEIDAWLLASVNLRCKGKLDKMFDALDPYREMWAGLSDTSDAKAIPGFAEDREYGAELLMLTSPDYGMPVAALMRYVHKEPELMKLSAHGPGYLKNVFLGYKDAYIGSLERMGFEESPGDPSVDEQRAQFAREWLHATARYFNGDREGGGA